MKFKVMDLIAQLLSSTTFQLDLETLDFIMWFSHNLTCRFETRHLSPEFEGPLVVSLLRILQIPVRDALS